LDDWQHAVFGDGHTEWLGTRFRDRDARDNIYVDDPASQVIDAEDSWVIVD
jgi:hypothetical protein